MKKYWIVLLLSVLMLCTGAFVTTSLTQQSEPLLKTPNALIPESTRSCFSVDEWCDNPEAFADPYDWVFHYQGDADKEIVGWYAFHNENLFCENELDMEALDDGFFVLHWDGWSTYPPGQQNLKIAFILRNLMGEIERDILKIEWEM